MLLEYIKINVPETVKVLCLLFDGRPGQNRNNTVIRFLVSLTDSGRFDEIIIIFHNVDTHSGQTTEVLEL